MHTSSCGDGGKITRFGSCSKGSLTRVGVYRDDITIFGLKELERSCNCLRVCVEIRSIATELFCPGTICQSVVNDRKEKGKERNMAYYVCESRGRPHEIVIRWFHVTQIPNERYWFMYFPWKGCTYCSRIPSTLLPRSFTSRSIRRASMRSESHCTKTWKIALIICDSNFQIRYLQIVQVSERWIMQSHYSFR